MKTKRVFREEYSDESRKASRSQLACLVDYTFQKICRIPLIIQAFSSHYNPKKLDPNDKQPWYWACYAFYSRVTKENAHAKSNSVEWLSGLKEVVSNNSLIFMIEGRERLYDNPKLKLNSVIFHNHKADWKEIRWTRNILGC